MFRNTCIVVTALTAAACSSYPAPTQRMADAMATSRGAQEVGADSDPQAKLHLRIGDHTKGARGVGSNDGGLVAVLEITSADSLELR